MEFIKYQHLERFGTDEVMGIEFGECYVFPKIDGTNASIWWSCEKQEIQAGSRKRHLTLDQDNAGFYEWVLQQENLIELCKNNPSLRFFGEWLVPHSLKTYKETAWRNFYVFDVALNKTEVEILHEGDSKLKYLPYEDYKNLLELYNINYIAPIAILENATYDQFINQLAKNVFLIEDGKGVGEGIVIKNYGWRNRANRQTWAKIVTSEFKEKHSKAMGAPVVKGKTLLEEVIANEFITKALVEKVHAKIKNESGWSSKMIPRLLQTVFYDLVKEESWNFVKKHKNPTINFSTLKHFAIQKIKESKPELF